MLLQLRLHSNTFKNILYVKESKKENHHIAVLCVTLHGEFEIQLLRRFSFFSQKRILKLSLQFLNVLMLFHVTWKKPFYTHILSIWSVSSVSGLPAQGRKLKTHWKSCLKFLTKLNKHQTDQMMVNQVIRLIFEGWSKIYFFTFPSELGAPEEDQGVTTSEYIRPASSYQNQFLLVHLLVKPQGIQNEQASRIW